MICQRRNKKKDRKHLPLKEPAIITKHTTERLIRVKKLFANEDSLAPKASAAIKIVVNYFYIFSSIAIIKLFFFIILLH